MKIHALGLLLAVSWQTCQAVDEVSYIAGAKTVNLAGVAVDGRSYYNVVLTATDSTLSEFSVTSATATDKPGAVSYDSAAAKLTIPSLRFQDTSTSTPRRYGIEMTLSGSNPLRFKISKATLSDIAYVDSTESAKVAAWLRLVAPPSNDAAHFSVIGVQGFNGIGDSAESVISASGPAAFYQNSTALAQAKSLIASRVGLIGPALQAGGITSYRDVQNLPWGMIEPSQGTYNYAIMDALIQTYQTYGIDYVGVAMPYAGWDLTTRPAIATKCQHLLVEDFKYLASVNKMDRYVNLDAFITMLQAAVERYDGDGVNDMAGLYRPVKYWQLHNEPEGEGCGQFRDDAASFVEFMRRGYNAVKAACATCQVINGGAAAYNSFPGGMFWRDYAALGGNAYIDINAFHFNEGKSGSEDVADFETRLTGLKSVLGSDKPIWITEFGVTVNVPNGQFVSMTEAKAAAWFTRYYTVGLQAGVTKFFSDAVAFVTSNGKTQNLLLPYYTNRLLEAKLGGFTAATKLATGQYRFTVNGSSVYVLWTGVPAELTGTVKSYDIYATETTGSAASLTPTQDLPLIVVK